jgi:ABC-type dipeptide/oligopeptide/nickel transport system permease component
MLNILPLGGMRSTNFELFTPLGKIFDILKHLILPTIVISLGGIASLTRIMRSSLVETLRQPFILMYRAKGLSDRAIFYKHALKNAINPLITIFGYQFSGLLSGAAITEIICNWPGLGQLMLTAVRAQDVYLVMAATLISGIMLLAGNLLADILLAWVDPRIRYD